MSAPIGKGDFVECVDVAARPHSCALPRPLVLGGIYRVHDVTRRADWPGLPTDGIELVEYPELRDFWRISFDIERFRPIYRPKSDLIEQLKQAAPDAVRELLTAD